MRGSCSTLGSASSAAARCSGWRSLNLQAGYWDIFWPQLIQGVGMSLLFVPLTTVAMDPIPRERMGNATSLFNLMRNIGGSIGIAVDRHDARAPPAGDDVACSARNVTPYDPASQSHVHAAARRRSWRPAPMPSPPPTAPTPRSSAWSSGRRRWCRSSASSSCSGVLFVALVPLVLLMKRPRRGGGPVARALMGRSISPLESA